MTACDERSEGQARAATLGVRVALSAAVLFSLVFASAEWADARKATPEERQALLEVWNADSTESTGCQNAWITRVSAYKPRIALIRANIKYRIKFHCTLGDGYALLRRPRPTSNRWRLLYEASDPPLCVVLPPRAAKELGFEGCMDGNYRLRR